MIKLEIEVTPEEMIAIGQVMNGYRPIVLDTPASRGEETEPVSPPVPTSSESDDIPPPPPTNDEISAVPPPPADVELAKGQCGEMIPWDARIHGKARKTNADGSWRLLQGIDRDKLVPEVEAELLAVLNAGKPAATAAQPTEPVVPPAEVSTPATVQVAPPAAPTTFAEFLPLVTAAKQSGKITDEMITAAVDKLGIGKFGMIAARPDLIPQMAELLGV